MCSQPRNETATTCQEARELPAFRDACCASQLIEYACGHHRSYVGEGAKGYQQAKAMALQQRNSLKWVEGKIMTIVAVGTRGGPSWNASGTTV